MAIPESLLADLQALHADLDTASLHRDFEATVTSAEESDPEAFLAWLRERGTLSGDDLATLTGGAGTVSDGGEGIVEEQGGQARYNKLEVLGAGAMGEVHIAKDRRLRRRVAFKEMKPQAVRSGQARRFLREVQITSQLEHPQIVPVYDLDLDGQAPGFAMKLVAGRDLSVLIDEVRALEERATAVDNAHSLQVRLEHFLKVCDAIHYAHSKGVVHRDLKPSNIRIGRHNEVYVLDWGVSRVMDGTDLANHSPDLANEPVRADIDQEDIAADATADTAAGTTAVVTDGPVELSVHAEATRVGTMVGTPAYMAPEQAQGLPGVDARADQFALGLILHELVTLRPARERQALQQVMAHAMMGVHQPIEHLVPGRAIPEELQAIIGTALQLKPEERYPSVAALADDLRNWLRGLETAALPDRGWRKVRRWLSHHRRWALGTLVPFALVIPVVAALAITGWSSYKNGQETVASLSSALRTELTERIISELEDFVSVPRRANQAHIGRVELGHLSVDALRTWRLSLLRETQLWPDLGWTQFGAADGRYVGVEHRSDGARVFSAVDAATDWRSFIWEMNPDGTLGPVTEEGPYDPRKRPWYQIAAEAGSPRWSEPYYYFSAPILAISLAHPYRDASGTLVGVFASDRTLDDISAFLRTQEVGKTGQTFIIDRTGALIATSVDVPVGRTRLRPSELSDPAVQAAAAHLKDRFGDLASVSGAEQWSFTLGSTKYLAQMAPFADPYGLDWTVVVVIPESDFTHHLEAHTRGTVLLGAGVLILAVLLGILLALRVRERVE